MPDRPVLTFAEIDAFDPQGPPSRKWCPLCGEGKPKDAAHRSWRAADYRQRKTPGR